jgi:hypothetical protein
MPIFATIVQDLIPVDAILNGAVANTAAKLRLLGWLEVRGRSSDLLFQHPRHKTVREAIEQIQTAGIEYCYLDIELGDSRWTVGNQNCPAT